MARRTRKQKQKARSNFTWDGGTARLVKRQTKTLRLASEPGREPKEKTTELAKAGDLSTYRKDLLKSLVVAGLILGAELVLYFAWR